jgi:hypothetical protein
MNLNVARPKTALHTNFYKAYRTRVCDEGILRCYWTENSFPEKTMFRIVRTLPFALALAALTIFTACGGSSSSKFRLVHAIPDGQPVDVLIDGKTVESAVAFDSVTPSSGYLSVSSGSRKLEVRQSGTTTDYFSGTPTFNSGAVYTVVATGAVGNNTVVAPVFTDNNATPTAGNAELRFIHASPSGPTPVDIYVVAPPGTGDGGSASISSLAYTQASTYLTVPAASGGTPYDILVTPAGFKTIVITVPGASFNAGQIRTFILVDVQNGGAISTTPMELSDLN